ncbi:MAG: hypothetical protein Q8Q40_08030 [Methylococcaceae bacterium]|nr:hypothetical protein [Methylococcaceae bacterium]MDP3903909.1 hypothetical protein [Methylococcaceae bacterium]
MTIFSQTNKTKVYLGLGLLAATLVMANKAQAELRYNITDLGHVWPDGINNSGQIAGEAINFDNDGSYLINAFVSNNYGQMINLGTLKGGIHSYAKAINASGQVAGSSGRTTDYGAYSDHAFVTATSGEMIDLGTLGVGSYSSAAYGINDSGLVTGMSYISYNNHHAFVTNENGVMIDLGTLGGDGSSYGLGINNSGQVTGTSRDDFIDRAFVTNSDGQMIDLGTLGGPESYGTAINDLGQVTGYSQTSAGSPWRAFVTNNDGIMIEIGSDLSPSGFSLGRGINNLGQVVGYYHDDTYSEDKAFVAVDGALMDLTTLLVASATGWTLSDAFDINDVGQIVGQGIHNGYTRGFILTPAAVPIPAAAWLFGSGLIGLLRFKRNHITV